MDNFRTLLLTLCLFAMAGSVAAHDFWVQPHGFHLPVGAATSMTIEVGHGPFRSRWSGNLDRVVAFRSIGPTGSVDRRGDLHSTSDHDATLSFLTPGTHVLVFESNHATSNLPAIRFNDYLKAEGLTPAIEYRAQSRRTDAPGREIYSRRCKSLIQVGPVTTKTQDQVTRAVGLTLEIVPDKNPYYLAPGELLSVHILYEGRPLAGALVKLTNLEFDVRPVAMHISDKAGRAAFVLPRTGDWLLNVIWTKPIKGNPNGDFDTTFSSLTFGYASSAAPRP